MKIDEHLKVQNEKLQIIQSVKNVIDVLENVNAFIFDVKDLEIIIGLHEEGYPDDTNYWHFGIDVDDVRRFLKWFHDFYNGKP